MLLLVEEFWKKVKYNALDSVKCLNCNNEIKDIEYNRCESFNDDYMMYYHIMRKISYTS